MATGDEFFALLTERLPAVQVQGWLGRDGEEIFRAVARVFETASDRSVAEIRAARVLLATFAGKAVGTITIAWDAATFYPYTVPTGTVVARTAWGVEYVLTEDIVRTAGQPAGSQSYEVEARWAGFEANADAGLVTEFADGVPGSFSVPVPAKYLLRSDGSGGSFAEAHNDVAGSVLLPRSSTHVATPWTAMAWVKPATDAGTFQYVVKAVSGSAVVQIQWSGPSESDQLGCDAGDGTDSNSVTMTNPSLVVAEWHHVALVNDAAADTLRLYVDGVSVYTSSMAAVTGVLPGSGATLMLFDSGGGEYLTGDIAGFSEFARAPTADELLAIAAAGPTWDLTLPTGAYATPDPAILYDGAADFGAVPNRGSAGSCDLDLNGGVSTVLLAAATTLEHSELTDRIAAGTIRITASSAFTGGSPGTLDLLARGAGLPVALGESETQVRRKLRGAPDIVTPTGVRAAVVALLGTEDVTTVEPWDGSGFAWGVSGWGLAAWMRSVWFAIVLVPAGTDTDVVQALVNRVRAFGYTVLALESA